MLRPEIPDPTVSAVAQTAIHDATSAHPGPVTAAANLTRTVLAIDPGNTESAYTLIGSDRRPVYFEKLDNPALLNLLTVRPPLGICAIEMVASYGMPVGREVFETCVWIGRFAETIARVTGREALLTYRRDVKLHHCHTSKAKDSNITQALVDRFAAGQSNHGKGTKTAPGWFYGFKADVWQAYALAVYVADTHPVSTSLPHAGGVDAAATGHRAPVPPVAAAPSTSVPTIGWPSKQTNEGEESW